MTYDVYVEEPQVCRGLATTTKTKIRSGLSWEAALQEAKKQDIFELYIIVDKDGKAWVLDKTGKPESWKFSND